MRIIAIVLCVFGLLACQDQSEEMVIQQDVDMQNPALAFCVQHGGKVVSEGSALTETYFCELENGSRVDVWEFYRDYQ
ncbi:DUF333 domain-containing protein [Pseudoalteromonas pernae]|uniref:DUF333 domain-containing protein n=1 Tax=Pseudoalteromonas pernae TaxID=3118054 RepID=UPI003242DDD7